MMSIREILDSPSHRSAAQIVIWAIAICISALAISMSTYTLVTRRTDWKCHERGHRFEARHDEIAPTKEILDALLENDWSYDSDKIRSIEKMSTTNYVFDLCTYCGDFKLRNKESSK